MGMRDDALLTLPRLRAAAFLMLTFFLTFGLGLVWYSNLLHPQGYLISTDQIVFWEASRLALEGHAAQAYDPKVLMSAVQEIDAKKHNFGWFYPPSFLLLILPLGFFTYYQAAVIFMTTTLGMYVAVMQKLLRGKDALFFLASSPGLWINLLFGQNGFLTAGLAGLALLTLEQRPVAAGVFIGLLSLKPHLALLFPVALLARKSWRTLLAAALTAAILLGVSAAALSFDTIPAWWHSLRAARSMHLENHELPTIMVSVFSMLRCIGVPVVPAYIVQALAAVYAVLSVWKLWRSTASPLLKNAALVTATFLVSPYLYCYDLAALSLAIAWMAKFSMEAGWKPGEKAVLALAWLMPLVSFLAIWVHCLALVQLTIPLLLVMILRRAGLNAALRWR